MVRSQRRRYGSRVGRGLPSVRDFPGRRRRPREFPLGRWKERGATGISVALEALELRAHVRSVLVAQVAVFLEDAIDKLFELVGEIGVNADRRNRRAIEDRFKDQTRGVAAERK